DRGRRNLAGLGAGNLRHGKLLGHKLASPFVGVAVQTARRARRADRRVARHGATGPESGRTVYAAYVTYLGASTDGRPHSGPAAMTEIQHATRDLGRPGRFVRMLTTPAGNPVPGGPSARH